MDINAVSKKERIICYVTEEIFQLLLWKQKANYKTAGEGMQQAKDYAEILGLKFCLCNKWNGNLEYDYITGIGKKS